MKGTAFLFIVLTGICVTLGGPAAAYTQNTDPETSATPLNPSPAGIEERSVRERALQKLFEGQRHMWKAQRLRTQAGRLDSFRRARAAFEQAASIDPTLAEAFTARSELAVTLPPGNIDEGIDLAQTAVKLNPQNYGGHLMLARLFTIKSRLNNGKLDHEFAGRAIGAWREVVRLDPRNAEGWAFIAAFSEASGKVPDQIEALRRWVASASPADVQFYGRVMKGAALTPESATLKLAETLFESGKSAEAIAVLVDPITDGGENGEAVSLMSQIVDSVEGPASDAALAALRQAEAMNSGNIQLTSLLVRLYSRLDRGEDAIAIVDRRSASLMAADRRGASMLYISLSDLYLETDRYDQAIAALEKALAVRGVQSDRKLADDEREFAAFLFEKLIHLGKVSDRFSVSKKYVDRARKIFGSDDPFPGRQMVSLLMAFGSRKEALELVQSLRKLRSTDQALLRTEATILAGLGRIDEAIAVLKERNAAPIAAGQPASGSANAPTVRIPASDEFSDQYFMAGLYLKAGRFEDAVLAAKKALAVARGMERRQLAKVSLAEAQRAKGDHAASEQLLHEVLSEMPRSPLALHSLGSLYVEKGEQLDGAIELIKRALTIDKRNAGYISSLGVAYLKLGRLAEAERNLRSAARLDADSSSIYERLGDLFKVKNDTPAAKAAWQRALRLSFGQDESDRLKRKLAN